MVIRRWGPRGISVGVFLAAICVIGPLAVLAYAEFNGDCVARGTGACATPGAACTVAGVAGVCTDVRYRGIAMCICNPNDESLRGQEVESDAQGTGAIPVAPSQMTFTLGPTANPALVEGSITFMEFGGALEVVHNATYSGTVTVQSTPTANPNFDEIELIAGTVTSPSVILPNGQPTGTNTWTFTGPGSTTGTLDRTTGEYTLFGRGTVINDLFPINRPIITDAKYFGTVNMANGQAFVDSTTLDLMPAASVPSLQTWSLILLVLSLLAIGMRVVRRAGPSVVLAATNADLTYPSSAAASTFVPGLYFKTLLLILVFCALGLFGMVQVLGRLSATDIVGTLLAAGVAAYVVQLYLLTRSNRA